jgi:hypothetical protein
VENLTGTDHGAITLGGILPSTVKNFPSGDWRVQLDDEQNLERVPPASERARDHLKPKPTAFTYHVLMADCLRAT